MRIRQFSHPQIGGPQGQRFLVPYNQLYMSNEPVPDTREEMLRESADSEFLNTMFRRCCAIAQIDGARDRALGLSTFEPQAFHIRTSAGPLKGHSIRFVLGRGASIFEAPYCTYDPARDSQAEGDAVDFDADNAAAQMSSALLFCSRSDKVLTIEGGGLSSAAEA